nr:MFS transporter [Massilistercora timonensis]
MENFKKYIVLWLSQSISQLGSSMTAFSFILWIYEQTHSALSISIISFCNYVPYILTSIFVGTFVDNHRKKLVMLVSDFVAAIVSLFALVFLMAGNLSVWHIYIINIIVGVSTAFQQPASSVAIAKIVPKDKLSNVSGMNSFSSNLVIVFSPMLAAVFFSIGGLPLILLFDLFSFAIAFFVLLFLIRIPERLTKENFKSPFAEILYGFHFLKTEKGILYIMLTMAVINFFSRLTYENILSPMILARSSENNLVLGIVNACMGVGGIMGGLLVSMRKESRKKANMIYVSAALSFLLGDLTMAVGRNVFFWSFAAFAASLPLPFIMAGENLILYKKIPENIQGRVFAVRNAVQYSTIPFGILLGGYLSDYVFEPFMRSNADIVPLLGKIVGIGTGSGMAVMFLCTGICGFAMSIFSLFCKEIQKLNDC